LPVDLVALIGLFRSRAALEAENLVLRHQTSAQRPAAQIPEASGHLGIEPGRRRSSQIMKVQISKPGRVLGLGERIAEAFRGIPRKAQERGYPLRERSGQALIQPSIFKHRCKRSEAAVGERIGPALTIVRDESPYGHGLHRMYGDADRALVNAGRYAEQNHSILCAERRLRFFHRLLLSPSLGELAVQQLAGSVANDGL
jgi:hypothetical protein